jgi:hypothetical protein
VPCLESPSGFVTNIYNPWLGYKGYEFCRLSIPMIAGWKSGGDRFFLHIRTLGITIYQNFCMQVFPG